jgi:hypothetical protein
MGASNIAVPIQSIAADAREQLPSKTLRRSSLRGGQEIEQQTGESCATSRSATYLLRGLQREEPLPCAK